MPGDARPLAGKKIVVTRARAQAGKLASLLETLGATVIEFPTIEIRPVDRPPNIGALDCYDWALFTSVNCVDYFFDALPALGVAPDFTGVKIGAVGPATEQALHARGLKPDLVAGEYIAEGLLAAIDAAEPDLDGKRVLIPRGDLARDLLPDALRARGADVSVAVFYRTAAPEVSTADIDRLLVARPDAVTFTSASTARNFASILGPEGIGKLHDVHYASIGPQTTRAAHAAGLTVHIESAQHDLPSLVEALVMALAPRADK